MSRLPWPLRPRFLDKDREGAEAGAMSQSVLELPDWGPVVMAYAKGPERQALAAMLALDLRLERIVHGASEPMLGQIRLAWWREEIGRARPSGADLPPDPLLSAILSHWGESRAGLLDLIDGWEQLFGDPPWTAESRAAFCRGRSLVFGAFAERVGEAAFREAAEVHGAAWGTAHIAQAEGGLGVVPERLPRLPRSLRPLALIGGLSRRATTRGGQPLMGDRMSPLVALKLGIFGV